MTAQQFYLLVRDMRAAQKNARRMKTASDWAKANQLEKQVDQEIKRVEEINNPTPKEGNLWK